MHDNKKVGTQELMQGKMSINNLNKSFKLTQLLFYILS